MRRESLITKIVPLSKQTINTTATVTSDAIKLQNGEQFSWHLKLSGSSVDVKLEYEIVDSVVALKDDVATGFDHEAEWLSPETNGVIKANATASTCDGMSLAVSKWVRFKITGNAANGADTVATLTIMQWS